LRGLWALIQIIGALIRKIQQRCLRASLRVAAETLIALVEAIVLTAEKLF
jgi:hypothetical protein